jgi:tetratricopeptide (TPR) repeat protein
MTKTIFKSAIIGLALMSASLPAASAMAADMSAPSTSAFIVKSAADRNIRSSAVAYRKGDIQKSISYAKHALRSSLSAKRAAIAHTNLCAAYAALGDMDNASTACASALELRPDYEPAQNNKAALTYQLAQK